MPEDPHLNYPLNCRCDDLCGLPENIHASGIQCQKIPWIFGGVTGHRRADRNKYFEEAGNFTATPGLYFHTNNSLPVYANPSTLHVPFPMAENFGLGEALYDPKDAKVDIIFVHGLGGHRIRSWTSNATEDVPMTKFWPKDFLPTACPTARILSFGYDASFGHFYPLYGPKNIPVGTTIDDHSAALLLALSNFRAKTETPSDRQIIFVAHSLGGLVCANAFSRQHDPSESNVVLVKNICGIIFLGTPFEGSEKARWGNRALQFLQLVSQTNNEKMKILEERSQTLASINQNFYKFLRARDQSHNLMRRACFFEEYPTYVLKASIGLVVPKSSATLSGIDPISIAASHSGMSKFEDEYRNGYKNISGTLSQWISKLGEAPAGDRSLDSIHLGETNYFGKIDGNQGIVMGNAYGRTKDAIRLTGRRVVNNYGAGWNAEAKREKNHSEDEED